MRRVANLAKKSAGEEQKASGAGVANEDKNT